jgi:methyltransferase
MRRFPGDEGTRAHRSMLAYTLLLVLVGMGRLLELGISRRRQREMARRGVAKVSEPHFPAMVLLHAGVLLGAGLEAWLLARPLRRAFAIPIALVLLGANGLRWWVIHTLGQHWNVQVMNSTRLGVVTDGPYSWIRHPNYVAVVLELAALPLLHGAWLTALLGTLAHLCVLRRRIAVEESVLLADPTYRRLMGSRPRFIPKVAGRCLTY